MLDQVRGYLRERTVASEEPEMLAIRDVVEAAYEEEGKKDGIA